LVIAIFRVYSLIQQIHTAYLLVLLFGFDINSINSKYGARKKRNNEILDEKGVVVYPFLKKNVKK
jgi:hypothetical protein